MVDNFEEVTADERINDARAHALASVTERPIDVALAEAACARCASPPLSSHPIHADALDSSRADPRSPRELELCMIHLAHSRSDIWTRFLVSDSTPRRTTSACSRKPVPDSLPCHLWPPAPDTVIFGSDRPVLSLRRATLEAAGLNLPADVFENYRDHNAQELVFIGGEGR